MDDVESTVRAEQEFNQAIRESYARTLITAEPEPTVSANGGGANGDTRSAVADFGSGARRAVATHDDMNALIRAAAFGVAYRESR